MLTHRPSEALPDEHLATPAGSGDYVVVEGDCMSSIAAATGHFWETLWNLPENAALKEARKDPNVLMPGDRVTVPPLRLREQSCATGKRHSFRRRGIPERLRLRLLHEAEPRRGEPFLLEIAGAPGSAPLVIEGTTTDDGQIDVFVPPRATHATLFLADEVMELEIGQLDPVDTRDGAVARLRNLGFLPRDPDDDETYRQALAIFQQSRGLETTWTLDAPTQGALAECYLAWTGGAR